MRELLPVLIVLLAVLLVALAAAVGVVVWMSGSGAQGVGSVLVYQIDGPSDVDLRAVVRAIDGRLNPSWPGMARVRPIEGRRIEVVVLGKDPRHVQRVERLLAHRGKLRLRIVANRRDHKSLFEQADPEGVQAVHNEAGDLLARWVPVAEGRESDCGSGTRTTDRDGREVLEVLVLEDQVEVTDEHIERIWADVEKGKPCAFFQLNETGRQLLEKLTQDHLPDPFNMTDMHRMAVVLDGQVWSCFPIQDTYHRGRGQIPGATSEEELRDLIDILQSDPLPAPVRQIEKRLNGEE